MSIAAHHLNNHARDRGCTYPGCDQPGYHTEVHHITPYSQGGLTQPTDLTLGCHPHHRLIDEGWTVRLNDHGQAEWLPPPHLPHDGPTINNFHHPERYLTDPDDDPDAATG